MKVDEARAERRQHRGLRSECCQFTLIRKGASL